MVLVVILNISIDLLFLLGGELIYCVGVRKMLKTRGKLRVKVKMDEMMKAEIINLTMRIGEIERGIQRIEYNIKKLREDLKR